MASHPKIAGIQYLRGVAAVGVVAFHAGREAAEPKYFGAWALDGLFEGGRLGVPLFFVVSGFIITVVSLTPVTAAPAVSVREFALRRAARILPVMWIAILSYGLLRLAGRGELDWAATLRALTLWPIGEMAPGVIWTLRHEAIFYVLFGLTFLGPRRLRWLLPIWFASPFILMAVRGTEALPDNVWTELAWVFFHPTCLQFAAGLALGLAWLRWGGKRPLRIPALFAICIGYFALIMAAASSGPPVGAFPLADHSLAALAFLPIVAIAVFSAQERASRIGLLLGDASFSIYLFHPGALSIALIGLKTLAPETPPAIATGVAVMAGIAAGIAAYFLVEKPVLGVTRRLLARPGQQAAPGPRADAW